MRSEKNRLKIVITGIKKEILKKELKKFFKNNKCVDYELNSKNPSLVVCYGGDGSLLFSERKYPKIPKIFIHKKKGINVVRKVLKKIFTRDYEKEFKELLKLECFVKKARKSLIAINDVNIHYIPPSALRFILKIDGRVISKEIIGDGIVIATPFGSNGYFKSITRKSFEKGIGIAFNNPTKILKPLIIDEKSIIDVIIRRGVAYVAVDNNPKLIRITQGDSIKVKASKQKARIAIYK
ncbi:MAG: hypothetical protein QXJ96_01495 [Candidatus Aenigmatarchaeota archaeon]|nr:NAD(+)/NADH kinase [Candidatus Aenigmarchaeota archaeon]